MLDVTKHDRKEVHAARPKAFHKNYGGGWGQTVILKKNFKKLYK
jgi:hypothetical protein